MARNQATKPVKRTAQRRRECSQSEDEYMNWILSTLTPQDPTLCPGAPHEMLFVTFGLFVTFVVEVGYFARADPQADGVCRFDAIGVAGFHVLVFCVAVDEAPPAFRDAIERRMRRDLVDARRQESLPVVRRHLVQRRGHVIKRIWLDHRR